MLDDLRNSASSYIEEEKLVEKAEVISRQKKARQKNFLGLTAPQRFIIALVLFFMTCACGTFVLMIFEKVVPPFF